MTDVTVSRSMASWISSRRRFVFLALIALALVLVGVVHDGDAQCADGRQLVVLVNAKNAQAPSLAITKKVYLGESLVWAGNVPVKAFMRPAAAPATDVFFRAIQVSPSRYKHVWQGKKSAGQLAPELAPDAATLVSDVASNVGAIGFAFADEVPAHASGVRVIPLR
jgi:hypothetical protein